MKSHTEGTNELDDAQITIMKTDGDEDTISEEVILPNVVAVVSSDNV